MRELNGKLEIDKSDIPSIDFTKLIAYSTTSWGSMGEQGGVNMLMRDGRLYHFNYFHSDIQPDDIKPLLDSAFEERGCLCLGGGGNYLYFHADDTDWLQEKLDRYMETFDKDGDSRAALYRKWVDFFREPLSEDSL